MEALPTSLHGGHLLVLHPAKHSLLLSLTYPRCSLSPTPGPVLEMCLHVGVESWWLWRAGGYGLCSLGALMFSETACSHYSHKPPEVPARLVAWPMKGPALEKCSALPLIPPEHETTQGNISISPAENLQSLQVGLKPIADIYQNGYFGGFRPLFSLFILSFSTLGSAHRHFPELR